MLDYLSRPSIQLGLTALLLLCGFAIGPIVNGLGRHFDTKLVAEWALALLLLIGSPILIARAFRTGAVGSRMGTVTRDRQPPIFWMTVVGYGIAGVGGLLFLLRLLLVGP